MIPSHTTADAHPRREKVPQIPLADCVGATMELTAVDRRITSRRIARHVGALKVRTHQDRSRGIRCAGQETLGTPQKQIVTDQPITPPLFTT